MRLVGGKNFLLFVLFVVFVTNIYYLYKLEMDKKKSNALDDSWVFYNSKKNRQVGANDYLVLTLN